MITCLYLATLISDTIPPPQKALENYHISDQFDVLDGLLKRGLRGARGMPIGVQVRAQGRKIPCLDFVLLMSKHFSARSSADAGRRSLSYMRWKSWRLPGTSTEASSSGSSAENTYVGQLSKQIYQVVTLVCRMAGVIKVRSALRHSIHQCLLISYRD